MLPARSCPTEAPLSSWLTYTFQAVSGDFRGSFSSALSLSSFTSALAFSSGVSALFFFFFSAPSSFFLALASSRALALASLSTLRFSAAASFFSRAASRATSFFACMVFTLDAPPAHAVALNGRAWAAVARTGVLAATRGRRGRAVTRWREARAVAVSIVGGFGAALASRGSKFGE